MAAALPHENPRILDPRQRSNVSQSPAECIVVDSEVDVDDEVIIVSVEGPAATRKSPAIGQRYRWGGDSGRCMGRAFGNWNSETVGRSFPIVATGSGPIVCGVIIVFQ